MSSLILFKNREALNRVCGLNPTIVNLHRMYETTTAQAPLHWASSGPLVCLYFTGMYVPCATAIAQIQVKRTTKTAVLFTMMQLASSTSGLWVGVANKANGRF